MKKFFWLVMVGVLYLMAAGCGSDNGTGSYTISGKVYSAGLDNSETGWPDVTVTLAGDLVATTKTDADGSYSFSVPNGHYLITPSYTGTTFYLPNNEVDVAGAQHSEINFEVVPLSATNETSTTRKKFKAGRLDYTTNAAFWTLRDHADESKAITIPGLIKTVVGTDVSTTMVPQGLCFADKYILISAYDSDEKMNSVIYVISKIDRKLRTVLSLPTKAHAGGLAFDGHNIWVCVGKTMKVIKYSDLETYAEKNLPSNTITFKTSVDVKTTASFASYYNGRVFVGEFNETATAPMYGYDVLNKDTETPTLKAAIRMEVPEKTQGVAFRETDGLMIVSTSYGRLDYGYLRFYEPNWNEVDSATVAFVHKNDSVKTLTVPPMSEGIVIDGDHTYVLYESGASEYADGASYCVYPMNRVLPFYTSKVAYPPVLIAGTNNKSNRIEVYKAYAADWNEPSALVWAWKPTSSLGFTDDEIQKWNYGVPTGDPMDVKLRNSRHWAGSTQVITTVGGQMAIVARYTGGEKGQKLWARNVGAGAYPHASELLPDGNIAVVATHGHWLRIYNTTAGATNYFEIDKSSDDSNLAPHGVLWDPKNNLLWVVWESKLVAYSVEGTKESPSLVVRKSAPISPNGHDLSAFYNDSDKLLLTATNGVYVYSKSTNVVTPLPGDVYPHKPKSISNLPDGTFVVPGAALPAWKDVNGDDNGNENSWSTDTVNFYNGKTGAFKERRKKTGAAFYKADVFVADY